MRNKILNIIVIMTAMLATSCSDWLDVQPSDRISEENNFAQLAGYKKALNGIYIELNSNDLYGRNLSFEYIEILGQHWAVSDENTNNKSIMNFEYSGQPAKSKATAIWRKAYNLIANTNLLLKNCDEHQDLLSPEYLNLIKGEALALRAYLHFDLFRLFGPIYKGNEDKETIPYYQAFSFNVEKKDSCAAFMSHVLDDLLAAEVLLQDDPIIKYGVKGNKKDIFLQFRNLRFNYYAVQALLARVYLYMGNTEKAYEYAKKVIDIQEQVFPWIDPLKFQTGDSPDRIFSSEVMFATQNLDRNLIYSSYFDGRNMKMNALLAPRADVIDYIFQSDKVDYRYASCMNNTVEISGTTYCIFNKYQGTDSLYNQMIPLIRISEMYLIAAETAPTSQERLSYFNDLLNHRGVRSRTSLSASNMEDEYWKEFFGEGQLFFFFKRLRKTSVKSAMEQYTFMSMDPYNYVVPIPDEETQYDCR